jgi:hypothetical protein
MFAVRGVAVSFSIFFILYSILSLALGLTWRRAWLRLQRFPAKTAADLMFVLRMAPLAISVGITLVFAVPSFVLLEPRAVQESLGLSALVLSGCGIALVIVGGWNVATALLRVSKTVARWSNPARLIRRFPVDPGTVLMRTDASNAPPLTAVGILRPRVWLSGAAEFVLTEKELDTALRHEVAHLRRRDNLRKLFLRLAPFPGLTQLENTWRDATEMAADYAAVSNATEALDLAAAVIKLSRLAAPSFPVELTTALVHSSAQSINARVERLIAWTDPQPASSTTHLKYSVSALVAFVVLAATYSALLIRIHAATEWLVR